MKSDRKTRIGINFNSIRTLMMCSGILVWVLCISCVTPAKKEEPPLNNRIMAENSAIKKRLPLIERENDVLKKENRHFRTKILNLETKTKYLERELTALGEKYDIDTTIGEMKIKELELANQKIETESSEKIKSLTDQNAALEKKLVREIKILNKKMVSQRESFQQEREKIITANTERESNLSSRIDTLEETLNNKEMENASLKKEVSALSNKLSEATALAEGLNKSRDALLSELEVVKSANARLTQVLNSQ